MKKFLPTIFLFGFFVFFLILGNFSASAQAPTPIGTGISPTPGFALPTGSQIQEGQWLIDSEVTFIGKNAARSRDLLNWTLRNYGWSDTGGQRNPLEVFWSTIRNIVYGLLVFFILVTAFILIITRGKSISVRRFIPRFVGAVLLITFSFAVIEFLYVIVDIFQGFFIRIRPNDPDPLLRHINDSDLLYVGWDYQLFQGLRVFGDKFAESAFISLLFTKLTALTYYAMVSILFVRKIILWFLIIVSPVFPVLLLYYPTRNTGKIWVGEFFRWLLYAPLFAVFLRGLVDMWKSVVGIPLGFDFSQASSPSSEVYPTGVNILLGGPGQFVSTTNSLNYVDTFAQYLIALIMLWIVIILPFILLQIFLDYLNKFNFSESAVWKQVQSGIQNFNKPPAISPPPGSPQPGGGFGRSLPFAKKFEIPHTQAPAGMARPLPTTTSIPAFQASPKIVERNQELLRLTNISVPTMRDVARFETTMLSRDRSNLQQVSKIKETLANIAVPASASTVTDRQHYQALREKLVQESRTGNVLATTVLTAANNLSQVTVKETTNTVSQIQTTLQQLANPQTITSVTEREKITEIRQTLERESQKGNILATNVLLSAKNISQVSTTSSQSSEISRIQQTLTQLANPAQITNEVEKQQVTRLREKLVTESQKGNILATEILATSSTTTSADIQKIREKLVEARSKGNSLAGEVLSQTEKTVDQKEAEKVSKELEKAKEQGNPLASVLIAQLAKPATTQTAFPVANRVQSVSLDDYEAVKKMWQENYKNLDVPQAISGEKTTRSTWIQDDVGKISETIDLLTSQDAEKVKQGMENVSNILPFLLIGGFSQTEIVAYLKAKQEAAKSVLEEVQKVEEEEETTIGRAKTQTTRTQTAQASRALHVETRIPQQVDVAVKTETPIRVQTSTQSVTFKPGKMNVQILNQTNLTLPKMHDIVKYESQLLTKDEKKREDVSTIARTLSFLAHPEKASASEKEKYATLRDRLVTESKAGDVLATAILSAAESSLAVSGGQVEKITIPQLQTLLSQVAKPAQVTSAVERSQMTALQNTIASEKEKRNPLAVVISDTLGKTQSQDVMEGVRKQFVSEHQKGNPLAVQMLSAMQHEGVLASPVSLVALPSVNRVQAVSFDDYETVKKLWQENYKNLDVPQSITGQNQTRRAWVEQDMQAISETIDLLTSQDAVKVKQGMKNVSNILPFLLIGGFSQTEIVAYLKAKHEAARTIVEELTESSQEETLVSRQGRQTTSKKQFTAASAEAVEGESTEHQISYKTVLANQPKFTPASVNKELLSLTSLSLPKIHDIVTYESQLIATDEKKREAVQGLSRIFASISEPEKIQDAKEKERFTALKERLFTESKKGDLLATTILTAAGISTAVHIEPTVSQVTVLLNQLNNPETVPAEEKSRIASLKETLVKEKEKGNQFAGTILQALTKTADKSEMEKAKELLTTAHRNGNTLASTLLASTTQTQKVATVTLPSANRLQPVSLDDYETVKKLWTENYQSLDIPQGVEGKQKRSEWLQSEVETISETVDMLSSTDQAQVKTGMQRVSQILPFLLIGGFSQTEVVAYLKAKQEAAKQVMNDVSETEENLITVSARKTTQSAPQILRQTTHSEEKQQEISYQKPDLQVLSLVNLSLPEMRDIVNYEKNAFVSDRRQNTTLQKVTETLRNVASPASIADSLERKRYETIREKLLVGARSGDPISLAVLSAAGIQVTPTESAKAQQTAQELSGTQIQQAIAELSTPYESDQTVQATAMKEKLAFESQKGNQLASQMVSQLKTYSSSEVSSIESLLKNLQDPSKMTDSQQQSVITSLKERLVTESKNGDSFAMNILSIANTLSQGALQPQPDQIQSVLTQLGNPRLVTGHETREKYLQFATRVEKESSAGNDLASAIMHATQEAVTQQKDAVSAHDVRQVFAQAADPTDITMRNEREEYKKLHVLLIKESKAGNPLAATILKTTQETATSDIEKTRREILEKGSDPVAIALREKLASATQSSISPRLITQIQTAAVHGDSLAVNFMSFVQSPSKEIEKLRKDLYAETKKGNLLAQAILRELRAPQTSEIDKLRKALLDAKKANDPLALTLVAFILHANDEATMKQEPADQLPKTNRVQEVSLDDYETVKKMWHDNYLNMDVPQNADGGKVSRTEWIQNDSEQITETINLLASSDMTKVKEGMNRVSDILPFLLIGGFSQTEIVAYLKAKQEAGKMVLNELSEKESTEEKVPVKKKEATQSEQAAELEDPIASLEEKEKSDKKNG